MSTIEPTTEDPVSALRRFARAKAPAGERCDLCGAPLPERHDHLIEPAVRRLRCACQACAILFGDERAARYRRVTRFAQPLPDFQMSDAAWNSLLIPINLAFFFRDGADGRIAAMYPSPAGPMESLLSLEAWRSLAEVNPLLDDLQPDIEALLVNRMGEERQYYRVSIDRCYELVGLIRLRWRGLSGGAEAMRSIREFFDELGHA